MGGCVRVSSDLLILYCKKSIHILLMNTKETMENDSNFTLCFCSEHCGFVLESGMEREHCALNYFFF